MAVAVREPMEDPTIKSKKSRRVLPCGIQYSFSNSARIINSYNPSVPPPFVARILCLLAIRSDLILTFYQQKVKKYVKKPKIKVTSLVGYKIKKRTYVSSRSISI